MTCLDSPAERHLPLYLRTTANLLHLEDVRRSGHEWLSPEVLKDSQAGVGDHTLLATAQRRAAHQCVHRIQHGISRSKTADEEAMLSLLRKELIAMPPTVHVQRREAAEEPDIAPPGQCLRLGSFGTKLHGVAFKEENGEELKPITPDLRSMSSQTTIRPGRTVSSTTSTLKNSRPREDYSSSSPSVHKARHDSVQAPTPVYNAAAYGPQNNCAPSGRLTGKAIQPTQSIPLSTWQNETSAEQYQTYRHNFRLPYRSMSPAVSDALVNQQPPSRPMPQSTSCMSAQSITRLKKSYTKPTPTLIDRIDSQQQAYRLSKPIGHSLPDGCPPPDVLPRQRIQQTQFDATGTFYPAVTSPLPQVPPPARFSATPSAASLDSDQKFVRATINFGSTPDLDLTSPNPAKASFQKSGKKVTVRPKPPPIKEPVRRLDLDGDFNTNEYIGDLVDANRHPATPEKLPMRALAQVPPSIAHATYVKHGGNQLDIPFGLPAVKNNIGHNGFIHVERPHFWQEEWRAREAEQKKIRQQCEFEKRAQWARHLNANPPKPGQWSSKQFHDCPVKIAPRCGPRKAKSTAATKESGAATCDTDDLPLSELRRRFKRLQDESASFESFKTSQSSTGREPSLASVGTTSSTAATADHKPALQTTAQGPSVSEGDLSSTHSRNKRKGRLAKFNPLDSKLDETTKALVHGRKFNLSSLAKKHMRDGSKRNTPVDQGEKGFVSDQTATAAAAPTPSKGKLLELDARQPVQLPVQVDTPVQKAVDSPQAAFIHGKTSSRADDIKAYNPDSSTRAVLAPSSILLNPGLSSVDPTTAGPRISAAGRSGGDEKLPVMSSIYLISVAVSTVVLFLNMLNMREYVMLLVLVLIVTYGIHGARQMTT